MGHIEGASRAQPMRFPEVLEDVIAEDDPVRFLDAFGESLDLGALGFRRTQPAATGRPADDPGDLLQRYLDGDMHRIRSSRRLERETHRTVELRWLLRKLHPDFTTIADVRKDTVTAFTQVFRPFVLLGKDWGLYGPALVAIDGSKLNAVKNQRRTVTTAQLRETLRDSDATIEPYRRALDMADGAEANLQQPTAAALQEKVRQLRERSGRYEGLLQAMDSPGQRQVSLTDPDRRAMPKSPTVDVGDTARGVVDATHHLFIVPDVTKAVTDGNQLRGIAIQATEALAVEPRTVVADRGDYDGEEITAVKRRALRPMSPSR